MWKWTQWTHHSENTFCINNHNIHEHTHFQCSLFRQTSTINCFLSFFLLNSEDGKQLLSVYENEQFVKILKTIHFQNDFPYLSWHEMEVHIFYLQKLQLWWFQLIGEPSFTLSLYLLKDTIISTCLNVDPNHFGLRKMVHQYRYNLKTIKNLKMLCLLIFIGEVTHYALWWK